MTHLDLYSIVVTGVLTAIFWTIYFVRTSGSAEIEFTDVFAGLLCGLVSGVLFPITWITAGVALVAFIIWGCIRFITRVVFWNRPTKSELNSPYGDL